MRAVAVAFLLLFILNGQAISRESGNSTSYAWYIEPELMAGKLMANYKNFPQSPMQSSFFVNIGRINYSSDNNWTGFYNYPSTGITASYSSFGNDSVLGKQISLIPFFEMNTSRSNSSSFCLKVGLGTSYFTTHYDKQENASDMAIGSRFTWAFQLFLYYKINVNNKLNLKIGGGYLHCSNGHTQLPNYGLNSAMISLSSQYFIKPMQARQAFSPNRTLHYFVAVRTGVGMHEYGASKGPVGGPKKAVYSCAVSGGVILKQNIRLHVGLAYRFYQHYYDYIEKNQPAEYIENPKWNASAVYVFLGSEFLIGHASIDVEAGVNLHKPFYDTHSDWYTKDYRGTSYWLKKLFPTRLGVKWYVINTAKMPANNVYVAANVNANFGQADFSELSLGFVRLLK